MIKSSAEYQHWSQCAANYTQQVSHVFTLKTRLGGNSMLGGLLPQCERRFGAWNNLLINKCPCFAVRNSRQIKYRISTSLHPPIVYSIFVLTKPRHKISFNHVHVRIQYQIWIPGNFCRIIPQHFLLKYINYSKYKCEFNVRIFRCCQIKRTPQTKSHVVGTYLT